MKPKRVLVVEDSEPCLRICVIALERAGFDVRVSRSVPEALNVLAEEMPEALVCDLLLGKVGTGLDVVAAAKASKGNVFCVAVTALPTAEIRSSALAAGFDAFLFKPHRPDELVELLAIALG